MVDLKSQYLKIKDRVDGAIQEVIDNTAFINGGKVKEFASNLEKYLDVKHVIPCGNGTDALQIAIMALELPEGSKIICPAFNYVATAETVALLGYIPQYIDVNSDTFDIDTDLLESVIDKDTKAIMPVHLFGQCANMNEIMRIAQKHNLFVIEDTAQAIGAQYAGRGRAGAIGDIGTTSFFPSKNLGCYGDGGAIYTNNDQLAQKCRMIANHGQSQKYIFDKIGVNSRLDTIQAAILDEKLKELDGYIKARQDLAEFYDESFNNVDGLTIPHRRAESTHVFHQYTLKVENGKRDGLKEFLASKGVPSMIYYPKPLHLHNAYSYLGYKKGVFPISEELCEKVLSLPMHTEMKEDQREYIVSSVKEFF